MGNGQVLTHRVIVDGRECREHEKDVYEAARKELASLGEIRIDGYRVDKEVGTLCKLGRSDDPEKASLPLSDVTVYLVEYHIR